jgi:HK97 family phage major capsid protein
LPIRSFFGNSPESRSSDQAFQTADPAFTQVTLGAYMVGGYVPVTIELSNDIPALSRFLEGEFGRLINNFDEDRFVNGTGSGQAQGILAGASAGQTSTLTLDHSLDHLGSGWNE